MNQNNNQLFDSIQKTINILDFGSIESKRKIILQPLVDFIQNKIDNNKDILLNFICTHNSRRSHLSQIWAQTAAAHYKIKNVFSYSGGTEATSLFPIVAQTLINTGFQIEILSEGNNPVYSVKYNENNHPVICFSKKYDDNFNPQSEFAAILTCSQADGGCPFIAGAEKRISMTFEDPKLFDNSPIKIEKYQERNIQIATELFYIFSQIKK